MLVQDWMGNIKGIKQRYSGCWISLLEWHFLLIKIHKEAANVNGFCDGCWIFMFLEKWCTGKQSCVKITQSKLQKVTTALEIPFPGNFHISITYHRPFKTNGVDLPKAAFGKS